MSTEISSIAFRAVSAVGDGSRAFPGSTASSGPAPATGPDAAPQPDVPQQHGDIEQALDELVARAAESGASLDFRIDEDSGRVVVSVVDRRDGTVLRQMPSEEALRIARNLARYEPHLIEVRA